MALKSLNQLGQLRSLAVQFRNVWLRLRLGVTLGANVTISLSNKVVGRRRGMMVVGADTLIAFKTLIVTHDHRTGQNRPVRIGERCFIGGGSMILPGVTIGDECIIGAGAVVFDDVPPRSIVGGNPATVLRRDIEVGVYGRLTNADRGEAMGWREIK